MIAFTTLTLRWNSLVVVCSHKSWSTPMPRIHSVMGGTHTVYSQGNHPILRKSCKAFTFILSPPEPSIGARSPRNLSGFPNRTVYSAPVSTRARTHWTFVGDQWIANSTCSLWSLPVPCRWVPQPSSYSNFQRISPPSFWEVSTAR